MLFLEYEQTAELYKQMATHKMPCLLSISTVLRLNDLIIVI